MLFIQAQELDISGNKAEAEKQANSAKNFIILCYILSAIYLILMTVVLSIIIIPLGVYFGVFRPI